MRPAPVAPDWAVEAEARSARTPATLAGRHRGSTRERSDGWRPRRPTSFRLVWTRIATRRARRPAPRSLRRADTRVRSTTADARPRRAGACHRSCGPPTPRPFRPNRHEAHGLPDRHDSKPRVDAEHPVEARAARRRRRGSEPSRQPDQPRRGSSRSTHTVARTFPSLPTGLGDGCPVAAEAAPSIPFTNSRPEDAKKTSGRQKKSGPDDRPAA